MVPSISKSFQTQGKSAHLKHVSVNAIDSILRVEIWNKRWKKADPKMLACSVQWMRRMRIALIETV